MDRLKRLWVGALVATVAAVTIGVGTLMNAPHAAAASLVQVTNFGYNPSNLRMDIYVPDKVLNPAPILVAVHYCTGTGPAFFQGSQFDELANQYGYIVIYPTSGAVGGCFDVASAGALRHDGTSDPAGIASMVKYVQQHYTTDPNRVFATGVSSGAMMTSVLLMDYPDIFRAGAAFAGVPAGCFATTNGSTWNSECAAGRITKTAQQWGDIVRNAYPGYTGARPRMQLWHGTSDETLNYVNFGEEIKQWTNVLGLSQTPLSTDTPASGQTRTRYGSSAAGALVEAISLQGVSHNLPVDAAAAIHFFGLDSSSSPTATPTPTPTATPTPTPTATPTPTPTATPTPTPTPTGSGSCTATFTIPNQWTGGFVASVKVTAGSAAINGWKVTLKLPTGATITNSWNAQLTGSSGTVTAANMSYNGHVAAAQGTEFGLQGSGTGAGATVTCAAS